MLYIHTLMFARWRFFGGIVNSRRSAPDFSGALHQPYE